MDEKNIYLNGFKKKHWKQFNEEDPFNDRNIVSGYVHRTGNTTYGMIIITHVNGIPCEQKIWATPKLGYPFGYSKDGVREYKWPNFTNIISTIKLDGTNVCGYRYYDADCNVFTTYKTRRMPFLTNKGEPFLDMWRECLIMYPDIEMVPDGMSLSWEMWGSRVPHLMKYDTKLEATLLFGILPGGCIIPACDIKMKCPKADIDFETKEIEHDLSDIYEGDEDNMEEGLTVMEDGIVGVEGHVWYLIDDEGHAMMAKVKPQSVRDVHWNPIGNTVPNHAIASTVMNSFEETEEPTIELINELLAEEFDDYALERAQRRILKILNNIIIDKKYKMDIIAEYKEHGFDIHKDKTSCMRYFGKKYGGRAGPKIYGILWGL